MLSSKCKKNVIEPKCNIFGKKYYVLGSASLQFGSVNTFWGFIIIFCYILRLTLSLNYQLVIIFQVFLLFLKIIFQIVVKDQALSRLLNHIGLLSSNFSYKKEITYNTQIFSLFMLSVCITFLTLILFQLTSCIYLYLHPFGPRT